VVNTFYQFKTDESKIDDQNYETNYTRLPTFEKYLSFISNANVTKLYETEPWLLGVDQVPLIYLNADSRHITYTGKNVTIRVLGVPLKTKEYEVHKYLL
jgi:hypothetical protein